MARRYIEYTTQDGDRWDLIALRSYGDPYGYEPIIVANPHVPIRATLPGGIRLVIPVRETPVLSDPAVPPWKRGGFE